MEKNYVKLIGSLVEVKMDRFGSFLVKLEFPHSEREAIKQIEEFIEKPITVFIGVEEKKGITLE